MRITESQLRSIVKSVIAEEQKRIDESSAQIEHLKQSIKAAALSAGIALSASQITSLASNMFSTKSDTSYSQKSSKHYKGMKGKALISHILKNSSKIPDEDLHDVHDVLRVYSPNSHSSAGSGDRQRFKSALVKIKDRLEQSNQFDDDVMYSN
jgi:hypothetical protein